MCKVAEEWDNVLLKKGFKQARAELGQGQGTQSSYPFLYDGWVVGIVKFMV